jgi:hypothetical protein
MGCRPASARRGVPCDAVQEAAGLWPRGRFSMRGGIRARSAVGRLYQITGPLRPATTDPPGLEPGPARLELAMLPVTPRIYACRLGSNQRPPPSHGGALPLSYGRLRVEPPAGIEPAPRPYKGRVLAFDTTEAGMETAGVEPTTSSLQARRSATRASSPCWKCGRVESNHHSARRRVYSPLSSPVLSVRKLGWPNGLEPIPRGSQPRMLRYTTATT